MRNLIFISFLFLLFSCKGDSQKKETKQETKQEPEWFSIEVDKALAGETKGRIPYSTVVKNIEYVPLQTTYKSLIGGGRHGIQIHEVTKKIIVADLKMFNRKDGSYIGNILSRGQGPGEYLYPSFLAADDEREELYVYDPSIGKILIAGYDGKYKGEFACGGDSDSSMKIFTLGNGNLLIARGATMRYSSDDFYIINVDTKEILSKRRSSALINLGDFDDCKHIFKSKSGLCTAMGKNIFWRYEEKLRYYDYLTDSIYTIGKDFKVKPSGFLDFEKRKQTREQYKVGAMSRTDQTWRIINIMETSNDIFMTIYSSNPRSQHVLSYSKASKQIRSFSGYLNDLDNGDAFGPSFNAQNESAFYRFISPENIKELIVEQGASAYTTEKEKAFKEMADKLKYDDNEFIMLYHLK